MTIDFDWNARGMRNLVLVFPTSKNSFILFFLQNIICQSDKPITEILS